MIAVRTGKNNDAEFHRAEKAGKAQCSILLTWPTHLQRLVCDVRSVSGFSPASEFPKESRTVENRSIDDVGRRLASCNCQRSGAGLAHHVSKQFFGPADRVRRGNHVVELEKPMPGVAQRLDGEHVQRRAGEASPFKSICQGLFVDNGPASGVD